ncbi:MAG: GNAT family protein [Pseudomonadota bacterium]
MNGLRSAAPIARFSHGLLRALQPSDAEVLATLANDRDIWLNLRDAFPHPYCEDDAEAFINHVATLPMEAAVGIEASGDGLAGVIGATRGTDIEACGAEVGYWLGRAFWGRGLASAALQAFRDWLFDETDLMRLYAVPFADNAASCRVLEKSGFVLEGRLRSSARKAGRLNDQLVYAFVRGDS